MISPNWAVVPDGLNNDKIFWQWKSNTVAKYSPVFLFNFLSFYKNQTWFMRVLCYDAMNNEKSMALLNSMKKQSEGWSKKKKNRRKRGSYRRSQTCGAQGMT